MLQDRFTIQDSVLEEINRFLGDPANEVIADLLRVVSKYGTPDEINAKAAEAGNLDF